MSDKLNYSGWDEEKIKCNIKVSACRRYSANYRSFNWLPSSPEGLFRLLIYPKNPGLY